MGRVADELTGAVAGLAYDNDTFMRRHAIKVETQVSAAGAREKGSEVLAWV